MLATLLLRISPARLSSDSSVGHLVSPDFDSEECGLSVGGGAEKGQKT